VNISFTENADRWNPPICSGDLRSASRIAVRQTRKTGRIITDEATTSPILSEGREDVRGVILYTP